MKIPKFQLAHLGSEDTSVKQHVEKNGPQLLTLVPFAVGTCLIPLQLQ